MVVATQCGFRENRLVEQIGKMKTKMANRMGSKRLIDVHELSMVTGVSVSTLYSWVSQRKIPFVKCGRLTKFDLPSIDIWIKRNTVKPAEIDDLANWRR